MSAITEPAQDVLERTRQAVHGRCIVCGRTHESGLGLCFRLRDDGSVEAGFDCTPAFQGYEGLLHGGITATALDGAMTNCLFAHGVRAVTAEMTVRFRHPIEVGAPLTVTARITRRNDPLFLVEAELTQSGQLKAKATGKFMETPRSHRA